MVNLFKRIKQTLLKIEELRRAVLNQKKKTIWNKKFVHTFLSNRDSGLKKKRWFHYDACCTGSNKHIWVQFISAAERADGNPFIRQFPADTDTFGSVKGERKTKTPRVRFKHRELNVQKAVRCLPSCTRGGDARLWHHLTAYVWRKILFLTPDIKNFQTCPKHLCVFTNDSVSHKPLHLALGLCGDIYS